MKELTLLKALGIEYNSNKLFDLSDASHLLESLLRK